MSSTVLAWFEATVSKKVMGPKMARTAVREGLAVLLLYHFLSCNKRSIPFL